MISQIIFAVVLGFAIFCFAKESLKIIHNIKLGKADDRSDQAPLRWNTMLRVAFGQSKMTVKPIPALLHLIVYAGFVIINIEMLEIVIDGLLGTHRIFSPLGSFYNFLIGSFEILAFGVLLSCILFLIRRNILKIKRFSGKEMTAFPKNDANAILITEILLMSAFLIMNGSDFQLQQLGELKAAGSFPISSFFASILPQSVHSLHLIERSAWWIHIIGILAFLNYLPYSKHFHILLAFPNTYFSNLKAKGEFENMASVTHEVKAMLDPSYTPPLSDTVNRFGAKDATDLTWINLLNAYTCTECGRCTDACPANQTGKLLSPRKIMMDTRDRITEIGKNIHTHGKDFKDDKSLLDNYITREEIWACTSCNACTQACPINIDPLNIIISLRQYAVMEESQCAASLNSMFGNIENNGAPWKYSPADRLNWANS